MTERYFKFRGSADLHAAVLARAGREGLRVGTYLREALERDLRPKEAAVAAQQVATPDHDTRRLLQELRLLLREIALHQNAQITARVAAQLNTMNLND